jgi:DNA-binding NtrC family response regulator
MKNILIVDDNRMVLHALTSYIKSRFKNYSILTAEDGQQAIEALNAQQVCLVLTDLEMPNIDGYKLIEYAKQFHASVPIIIMTGSWSFDLRMLVCKTGIARCIEKPFRFEELAQLLSEVLEQASPSATADKEMAFFLPLNWAKRREVKQSA